MIQARSVRLAAVVVLGGAVALATSACGGPMQAGAAAVVQGQRTTDATVQGQVASIASLLQKNNLLQSELNDAQRAGLAKAQINLLVQEAVYQKAADDLGVTVTAADDAKTYSTLVEQARTMFQQNGLNFTGSDNEAVALADLEQQRSFEVAPSAVPVYVHLAALATAVRAGEAGRLGVNPNDQNDQNGQAKLDAQMQPLLLKAAAEVHVKISPRYGSFDPAKFQFTAAQTSWIRPTKAQLAAAAEAQAQQTQ